MFDLKLTNWIRRGLLVALLPCILLSCEETEPGVFNPDFTSPLSLYKLPEIEDADAILLAIKSTTYDKQFDTEQPKSLGLANAAFYDNSTSKNMVDVGQVLVYEQPLQMETDNSYRYVNPADEPMGIEFIELISWTLNGGNGFTATELLNDKGWPIVGRMNNPNVITKGKDFTIASEFVANSDEIVFRLIGEDKTIESVKDGNDISHTFTADEIEQLGGDVILLQMEVSNTISIVSESKKFYLVNREVQSDQLFISE